ncbi:MULTISPECIES: IS3 family transposase [Lentilactobacillus]
MITAIQNCIDWYNQERRQKTLNGMTPERIPESCR